MRNAVSKGMLGGIAWQDEGTQFDPSSLASGCTLTNRNGRMQSKEEL